MASSHEICGELLARGGRLDLLAAGAISEERSRAVRAEAQLARVEAERDEALALLRRVRSRADVMPHELAAIDAALAREGGPTDAE